MTLISLSFHDDGAPRQRAALRDHLAAGGEQLTLHWPATPWTTLLQTLRWARRQDIPIHCEQPPPWPIAWLLSALFPAKHLSIHATRWPRMKERTPLTTARWHAATPTLAKAWKHAGAVEALHFGPLPPGGRGLGWAGSPRHGNQPANILWLGPLFDPGPALSSLWAFDVLSIIDRDVHLHLCGTGPGEASLRRFAANLPARARIHFHPAPTENLWQQATVMWVNDPTAAVPDAWLEALSRGLPCLVATPHAATGYAAVKQPLKPHAPPAWATATKRVLEELRQGKEWVAA